MAEPQPARCLPAYADDQVTVHLGDCLDVLAGMADSSVDAIVTDPPYGLGFMGKAWDDLPPGLPWACECLRVLKPGGHLLAFGGTRTWHRLAVAVEDAGFEMRDSIAWLYGSGFPKSLDVSKAIDKVRSEDLQPAADVAKWLVDQLDARGLTRRDVTEHFGKANIAQQWTTHWTTGAVKPRVPSVEQWAELRRWLDLPDTMDAEVWRLNGRKGKPGEAFQSREVLRETVTNRDGGSWAEQVGTGMFRVGERTIRETAPATPLAQQWAGWGTALKPAFEPIVVARKPLAAPGVNVLDAVESSLRAQGVTGEIRWTSAPASAAAQRGQRPSSSSTAPQPAVATSANPAAASGTPSAESPTANGSVTTTRHGATPTASTSAPTPDARPPSCETKSSPPMVTLAPAATSGPATSSLSITSREEAPPTARPRGARSTPRSSAKASLPAIASFAGTATGLTGSRATVRIDRLADGTFVWPDGLPTYVPDGPITVAANVLAHGVGALNIDATRVATTDKLPGAGGELVTDNEVYGKGLGVSSGRSAELGGRWPTNVVLDDHAAAELDAQSGTLKSGDLKPYTAKAGDRVYAHGLDGGDRVKDYTKPGDSGGASRFFPVFKYQAKAPARERIKVDGVAHPTVKPLELMRWLVRLVTPPGGVVLDPFAGSGTTAEACVLEGFDCVVIERETDYLPLIVQRIRRAGRS